VDDGPWPIDDFARLAGTTVRNVRLYQERGLLPPPERPARRALYGPEHLRRLRLVLTLLKRGYPLAAIRELVSAWEQNRSLGDVLGFEEALAQPFTPDPPRRYSVDELQQRFPSDSEGAGLQKALELGLLVVDGDGFVAPVPSQIEVGAELVAAGVPLGDVLAVSELVQRATDELGNAFVQLFLGAVWEPFARAGEPAEGWATLTEALDVHRRIWPRAVLPALAHAIEQHVEAAARAIAADEVAALEQDGADATDE
jgi:DNA-binding transcriptional MerR regulator